MKTAKQNVQSSCLTKVEKRHLKSLEKLKVARKEYRSVRAKLIEAIMADKADGISPQQVSVAKMAFSHWLKHRKRLRKCLFNESNNFGRVLGEVSSYSDLPGNSRLS